MDEAVELYKEANQVFRGMRNQQIVQHEQIQAGVIRITYSGGVSILVNNGHFSGDCTADYIVSVRTAIFYGEY